MDNSIKQKLLSYANNDNMKKYIEICEFYQDNPTKKPKYQFHHIFPAFLYRLEKQAKNRSKIIEQLDKEYNPDLNVVKLPAKFHLIAHYYLAKALMTKEAINAFQIFLDDYYTKIDSYTIQQVKELGQLYEDTCLPNKFNRYMTEKEKEKYYNEQFIRNKKR